MPTKEEWEKALNKLDDIAELVSDIPHIKGRVEEAMGHISTLYDRTRELDINMAAQKATCKARHNGKSNTYSNESGQKTEPKMPEDGIAIYLPYSGKFIAGTVTCVATILGTLITILIKLFGG